MNLFGPPVKTIDVAELAERLEAGHPTLVDVREPSEFADGHVPGAVNVPMSELRARVGELDPAAETLLICQSGNRSATAAKVLTRAGFARAYSVKGGTSAWRGPLER